MNINWDDVPKTVTKLYFDVGLSYYAPYAQKWLEMRDNIMVVGFEPNPNSNKILMNKEDDVISHQNIHHNKLRYEYIDNSRFKLIQCAISNVHTPSNMDFYALKGDGISCSGLFKFNDEHRKKYPFEYDIITVPVYSLEYFLKQVPYDRFPYISYIKIDTQGSDLNVLKSAGDYLKDRVVYITAEPDGNMYEGGESCNHYNIVNYMTSQNFIYVNHPNTRDPTFLNKRFIHLKDEYIYQKF